MNQIQSAENRILAARIRIHILEMISHFGSGHVGGSLSVAETLAVLYNQFMHYDPENPDDPDRDVVVLSKGHAGPALYSVLAEKGFFDPEMLLTLNQGGTHLPSHPDRMKTPGVDMTTGSLGQGTSTAAGMALAVKKRQMDRYVYCIVGDGELNEGQCWEAFQFMASYPLNNCIVLIDNNKKQLDGCTRDVLNPFSIEAKMKAFGFYVQSVDGSDVDAISQAIEKVHSVKDQASCIVLDTIKGQGVPYFENMISNHSVRFNNEEVISKTREAISHQRELIAMEEAACLQ